MLENMKIADPNCKVCMGLGCFFVGINPNGSDVYQICSCKDRK